MTTARKNSKRSPHPPLSPLGRGKRVRGTVYLIGAGPGDRGLLTLRGASLLQKAGAVVYDWLVNPSILEFAPSAEKFYVGKNIAKKSSPGYVDQKETNGLLVKLARQGKTVVRLKGGDPFIFGRGGEEASYLKEKGIRFEVVPGVSAGYAVPAYAGIPVTDRRFASLVTFVTGHEDPAKKESSVDWKKLAGIKGTLVSFMGVKNLPRVAKALIEGGKSPDTPVSVIEWGTLPKQRVAEGTLKTIAQKVAAQKIGSPAVTVIGEVNQLRKKLAWFEKKPLASKTILITRARTQASGLRQDLEELGARVLEFPAIRILPPGDWGPLDQALNEIGRFEWMIFTSANGVEHVFKRLFELGKDARIFAGIKIAAIGEATEQALKERGLGADLVPGQFTSEALVSALKRMGEIDGRRFLLARTDIAPDYLRKSLESLGGKVREVTAYRTVPGKNSEEKRKLEEWLKHEKIDFVTFTSSSTVKNFFDAVPKQNRSGLKTRFISIGPVTSQTLRSYGHTPFREAAEHTIPGLIEVITNGK